MSCVGMLSAPAYSANWLMLQGTEKVGEAPRAKVWGFMQPTYFSTDGTKLPVGPWAGQNPQFNVHQPDLSSNKIFQIQRARVGVRGNNFPLDNKINYFILAEYGNNGITQPGGDGGAALTDATVTFNHIPGARIRVGQMKVPMSEEVYQGIFTFNYINFTNVANQQLIERPFWTDGTAACNPTTTTLYSNYCNGDAHTQFRSGSVAVRDIGVQVFDTFTAGTWETSYAALIGQGGIKRDSRNDSFDTTLYLSTEKVFGGQGPRRTGMKFYAWATQGKRTIYDSATLAAGGTSLEAAEREFDRKLSGIGTTYWDGTFRFWAEYIKADGMIFNGSTGGAVPGAVNNAGTAVSQFILSTTGESDGYYLDFGWRPIPSLELDYRYDRYNRVTNLAPAAERLYETHTVGLQYFFNRKTRFMLNYEFRSLESPNEASTAPANLIGDAMDDRLSAQVFLAF